MFDDSFLASFPITKNTLVITTALTDDPNKIAVFKGQIHDFFLSYYDANAIEHIVIGLTLFDTYVNGDYTEWVQNTISYCESIYPNAKTVSVLYDYVYFNSQDIVSKLNYKSIKVPFFLLKSLQTNLKQFKKWTPNYKKALFLVGDIRSRPHRLPLLLEFSLHNDLHLLEYSLNNCRYNSDYFTENAFRELTMWIENSYGIKMTLADYENLYNKYKRDFADDKIHASKFKGSDMLFYEFPSVWNETSLHLANETHFKPAKITYYQKNPNVFPLSEKIWKPILAGKPFLTCSYNDSLDTQLEELGFRTFSKYTDIKEKIYCDIKFDGWLQVYNHLYRIRIKSFLRDMDIHKKSIEQDLAHNYRQWKFLGNQAYNTIITDCPALQTITRTEFCTLFSGYPNFDQLKKYLT